MNDDAPTSTKYLAHRLTDTARVAGYVNINAHDAIRWFILDVRSLVQHLNNIISNDAHIQP
jgi:hypothetical protein